MLALSKKNKGFNIFVETFIAIWDDWQQSICIIERIPITVSLNPVQGNELNLQFKNKQEGRYDIRLVDAAGRLQLVNVKHHDGGNSTYSIRLPFAVGRGIYQLIVTDADKNVTTQQLYMDRAN